MKMIAYDSYLGNKYWVNDDSFASGGEGSVHEVHNYYNTVAKIYTPSKRTEHQERKLKSMLGLKLDDGVAKQYAWPLDILYQNGRFVGFVMNKIQGVPLNLIHSDRHKDMPLSKKITIAKNLCVAVHDLHESGKVVVGDLNPNNILVVPSTGLVRLIDCDSFHVTDSKNRTYRCEVAIPEYLAPSVSLRLARGESLKTAHLPTFTHESDRFSLAIHLFQLLQNGAHPYAIAIDGSKNKKSVVLPQPSENMKKGLFPYHACPEGYKLPIYALSFEVLPESLRKLFIRRFSDGQDVSAQEWFDALCDYEERLKTCKRNHNHEYRKGLRKCPYCTAGANTSKLLATGTMPRSAQAKPCKSVPFRRSKALFWLLSLVLAVSMQLMCCTIVGLGDQLVGDIASFIGISHAGLNTGLLTINCACGMVAMFVYNCTVRKREIHLSNYLLSQFFSILGFMLGFALYSLV